MPPPTEKKYTAEEYLDLESKTGERYQFFNGEVFMMAGGSIGHTRICANVSGELRQRLCGKDYEAFGSELKIYLRRQNTYVYPQMAVVCGPLERVPKVPGAVSNPVLLVENNLECLDRFYRCRRLPSLREYVLIDQSSYQVEVRYRRPDTDIWVSHFYEGLEATVELRSLELTLPMHELYLHVEMDDLF